jgi:hypothetical protein
MTTYSVLGPDDENYRITVVDGAVTVIDVAPVVYTTAPEGGQVDSVNGQTGAVTLDTDDIAEGSTNLYYTDARVDAKIAAIDFPVDSVNGSTGAVVLTTTDVAEGDNLYYTDARVDTYLQSGGVSAINFGNNTTLTWNAGDGTLEFPVNADVTLQIGQENLIKVKNLSGQTLVNGAVVRVTGAQGGNMTIDLANNTSDAVSADTIAVMTQELTNNAVGFATTEGLVRGLDTSAFTEGVVLWLDGLGVFTQTKPLTPAHLVQVGYVVRSHATEGSIFVSIKNGWELDELHDVLITNVQDGQGIVWDSANGYWKNETISVDLTGYATEAYVDANVFSGDYNDLINTPTIPTVPTNVSAFVNDAGYITGYTESDPVFAASVAGGITLQNVTDWNSAYNWGDHSAAGYALAVDAYTDAAAISALETNADTVLQGNLTVEGDFVVFNQVKITNFEFPLVDYGQTSTWASNTATLDMTAAYINIIVDTSDPTLVFDTSGYLTSTNVRNVILQIDYRSGNGNINFPSNVFWDGLDKPNFGGNPYNRTVVRLVGRASGWIAKQDVVFNPVPGNPFGSTKTSLAAYRLTDIGQITDGSAGQVLSTNGDGTFQFVDAGSGGGATQLNDLSDVDVVSPQDGDILRYNGLSSTFQNTNLGLSLTPILSGVSPQYSVTQTVTIDNYASYQDPNVWAEVRETSTGNLVRSNEFTFDNGDGTVSWHSGGLTDGDYTVYVKVQDFGDLASDTAELTITKTSPNFQYWRVLLTGCTSYNILDEVRFFTDAGQSGTSYPPIMTSNTAPAPYVITSSHEYAGYAAWEAFDAGSGLGSGWWNLGQPGGYEPAWIAVDMGTPQTLTSYRVRWPASAYKNAAQITIQGSATGAWAGEETSIATATVTSDLLYNIG